MRITTNMLYASAMKAGIPLRSRTLLDYMNKDSNNALMNALSKNRNTAVDFFNKKNYEKIDGEATKLGKGANTLLQDGEDNPFEKARTSGDATELYAYVEKVFDDYNSLLGAFDSEKDTMNAFYERMLKQAAVNNMEGLEQIGVSIKDDGTVKVDMNKLRAEDLDKLESVLGQDSEFMNKVAFISERVSDNAQANIESLGNTYNIKGNSYSAGIGTNKYDFWS